jgi:hypothetical protein
MCRTQAASKLQVKFIIVAPAFVLIAIGCMWFVTRGEAREA